MLGVLLLSIICTGCAFGSYQPQTIDEYLKMYESANIRGCSTLRIRANPPGASIDSYMVIAGGNIDISVCTKASAEMLKALGVAQ